MFMSSIVHVYDLCHLVPSTEWVALYLLREASFLTPSTASSTLPRMSEMWLSTCDSEREWETLSQQLILVGPRMTSKTDLVVANQIEEVFNRHLAQWIKVTKKGPIVVWLRRTFWVPYHWCSFSISKQFAFLAISAAFLNIWKKFFLCCFPHSTV